MQVIQSSPAAVKFYVDCPFSTPLQNPFINEEYGYPADTPHFCKQTGQIW